MTLLVDGTAAAEGDDVRVTATSAIPPAGRMTTSPFWVSAFDFAPGGFDRRVAFWQGVTGYALSGAVARTASSRRWCRPPATTTSRPGPSAWATGAPPRPARGEPTHAAEAAIELGAHVLVRHELGYVVLRSPGGFVFCFVTHPASRRPQRPPGPTATGRGSTRSAWTSRRRRTTRRWRSGGTR